MARLPSVGALPGEPRDASAYVSATNAVELVLYGPENVRREGIDNRAVSSVHVNKDIETTLGVGVGTVTTPLAVVSTGAVDIKLTSLVVPDGWMARIRAYVQVPIVDVEAPPIPLNHLLEFYLYVDGTVAPSRVAKKAEFARTAWMGARVHGLLGPGTYGEVAIYGNATSPVQVQNGRIIAELFRVA